MLKYLEDIHVNAYLYIIQITQTQNTMKASDKNRIRTIAQEIKELNEWKIEDGERIEEKSWITCIKEAINYVEPKRSNKLSECMGRHNEVTNQRYNHITRRFEKI